MQHTCILLNVLSFRKDRTGYVLSSTSWDEIGNAEVNAVAVVKLNGNLDVQWSKKFGMAGGNSQGRYSVLFKFDNSSHLCDVRWRDTGTPGY